MNNNATTYVRKYTPSSLPDSWRSQKSEFYSDTLSSKDTAGLLIAYVENLPYNRQLNTGKRQRVYLAKAGKELQSGKSIQKLLLEGIKNTCQTSARSKEIKDVVLHNAYFFPSAALFDALAKMVNGYWDCSYVRLRIITNSIETTDLGIVNFVARSQLKTLFNYYLENRNQGAAELHYYEYANPPGQAKRSLHTKVTIMGDDVYLGSANADVRSYMKDSNNGFYLRGAKDFIAEYTAWLDGMIATKTELRDVSSYYLYLNDAQIAEQNREMVSLLLGRWDHKQRVNGDNRILLESLVEKLTGVIRAMAEGVVDYRTIEVGDEEYDMIKDQNQRAEQMNLRTNFDRLFKAI